MALTPLLLLVHDRVLVRRTARQREDDTMDEARFPVIIAGFGRFGQIVGRLLFASGIKATVLDHDPDQIEMLKRFRFRVHYGDATRSDLLHAAGAREARVLVNAIDDPATSIALVEVVRHEFPELPIVARARNVGHYLELRRRGVTVIERETFEAALLIGRRALETLGVGRYEAKERADRFRRHNVEVMNAILPHFDDAARRTQIAIDAREQLERQFEQDRIQLDSTGSGAWHDDAELPLEERRRERV
jgi:glutathione-regulated potassium-efflux system ancillary protein KefC